MTAQMNEVVELDMTENQEEEIEETQSSSSFTVIKLLENLVLLGMNTVNNWETIITSMKTNPDVMSCPHLLNLYFTLRMLFLALSNFVYLKPESQEKLLHLNSNEMTFDEIKNILNPSLKKKSLKEKTFSSDTVQKLMLIVRSILQKNENCKVNKNSRKRKHKKSFSETSSIASDNQWESASELDSEVDEFEKLFKKSNKKSKSRKYRKVPIVIKQMLQYQKNNKKYKLTTPGESGGYLVKIEVTDTKDLQKCPSEKQYWTKVSKKGYFLIEDQIDPLLKQVNNVLVEVGKRFDNIENVTTEVVKTDDKYRRPY